MSNFEIRKAVLADIPQIAQFEKEISIISFGDEAIIDLAFHEKKLKKSYEKNSDGMFVLTSDGIVSGWMWLEIKTNFLTEDKYVNFHSFYLSENLRGGEEADRLLEYGMDYYKKSGALSIVGKVNVNNLPMRALYKKFGFAPTHLTMEYQLNEEKQC